MLVRKIENNTKGDKADDVVDKELDVMQSQVVNLCFQSVLELTPKRKPSSQPHPPRPAGEY